MFCRKCGANIPDDSQFCLKCGAEVVPMGSAGSSATTSKRPDASNGSPEQASPNATEEAAASQTWHRPVFIIGLITLLLWAVRDAWHYGLFGPAFDPLVWLLGIPLYVLYRKSKNNSAKVKVSPMKKAEPVQESKPQGAASRWVRLGVFLCVAIASAILGSVAFLKGNPSAEELTEKLTKASLCLGLAAWGFTEVLAGRWLTTKRTLVGAIALYGIAFALVAAFLGKPLATKLIELNEEQAQLDQGFTQSATGRTLLQPQSFASPQVAAASLAEFARYADATESLNRRKETMLLERDDQSFRDRWAAYFEATRSAASATEELYRFASDPSRHVHIENGVVIITDTEGYNKRMDTVNAAMEKLRLATDAIKEPLPRERR